LAKKTNNKKESHKFSITDNDEFMRAWTNFTIGSKKAKKPKKKFRPQRTLLASPKELRNSIFSEKLLRNVKSIERNTEKIKRNT